MFFLIYLFLITLKFIGGNLQGTFFQMESCLRKCQTPNSSKLKDLALAEVKEICEWPNGLFKLFNKVHIFIGCYSVRIVKLVGISICCFWELVLGWEEGNSTGFKVLAIGNLRRTKDVYQSDLQGKILLLLLLSGPLGKAKKRLMIQFFSLLSAHLSNVPWKCRLCTRNDREPGSLFPLEAHGPLEKINKHQSVILSTALLLTFSSCKTPVLIL